MKTNTKLVVILAVMFVLVSSYSMQTVAAIDLDPGGGGDPQQVYVTRTASDTFRVNWDIKIGEFFGRTFYRSTWMEIQIHTLALSYSYGPDGYVTTGYAIWFEFSWDITGLEPELGSVYINYGASSADQWGHIYDLDDGELGNGELEGVSDQFTDIESSWSIKYFKATLTVKTCFDETNYALDIGYKLTSPTLEWDNYLEELNIFELKEVPECTFSLE